MSNSISDIENLVLKEGWKIKKDKDGTLKVLAFGEIFPLIHPLSIHLKLYRTLTNPERRYFHMKAAHDYLWPDTVWHYWTERRFREHCIGWNYIAYAGCAASSKSFDAAKIAILFWLANPTKRTVIVASTTMGDLQSRIWGYVLAFMRKAAIPLPIKYTKSPNPIITWKSPDNIHGPKNIADTIHGMFAIPAKKGDDDKAISGWIGRHPDDAFFMMLDEATDMPLSLLKALPNLEAKPDHFFLMAIGNSSDINDLHGVLCTPKAGWKSVDPFKDNMWETTQRNGLCLYFNAYESPAIHESDDNVRAECAKFLITKDQLDAKELEMGAKSSGFFRFVLGFWRKAEAGTVVIDPSYVELYGMQMPSEWAGMYPLQVVAGLDPAFTSGGDNCILRLAVLGVDTSGKVVLDFKGASLLFKIRINAISNDSAELQIADQTIAVLKEYNVPIHHLCIDMSGAGRGLSETIRLRAKALHPPKQFYSHNSALTASVLKSKDYVSISNYELWFAFKGFIEHFQIRGLDTETCFQLTHRLIEQNEKTKKIQLEPKNKYQQRIGHVLKSMGRSPDEADAASYTLQSAIINYGFSVGQNRSLENTFYLEKIAAMKAAQMRPENVQQRAERPNGLVANFTADVGELLTPNGKLFW